MASLHEVEQRSGVVEVDSRHQAAATESRQPALLASGHRFRTPPKAFPEGGFNDRRHGRSRVERRLLRFLVEVVIQGKGRAHTDQHMSEADFCQRRKTKAGFFAIFFEGERPTRREALSGSVTFVTDATAPLPPKKK